MTIEMIDRFLKAVGVRVPTTHYPTYRTPPDPSALCRAIYPMLVGPKTDVEGGRRSRSLTIVREDSESEGNDRVEFRVRVGPPDAISSVYVEEREPIDASASGYDDEALRIELRQRMCDCLDEGGFPLLDVGIQLSDVSESALIRWFADNDTSCLEEHLLVEEATIVQVTLRVPDDVYQLLQELYLETGNVVLPMLNFDGTTSTNDRCTGDIPAVPILGGMECILPISRAGLIGLEGIPPAHYTWHIPTAMLIAMFTQVRSALLPLASIRPHSIQQAQMVVALQKLPGLMASGFDDWHWVHTSLIVPEGITAATAEEYPALGLCWDPTVEGRRFPTYIQCKGLEHDPSNRRESREIAYPFTHPAADNPSDELERPSPTETTDGPLRDVEVTLVAAGIPHEALLTTPDS